METKYSDPKSTTSLINMIRIIIAIQSQPGIKTKELAEKCNVSTRTISRMIPRLEDAGIPIERIGHGQGYRFLGDYALAPPQLTLEEASALVWIRPLIAEHSDAPALSIDALDKIIAALVNGKRINKDIMNRTNEVYRAGKKIEEKQINNHLETILQAIIEGITIETTYHTQYKDCTERRKIDPYYLVPRENRLYLVGYCHSNDEFRTFRISRFQHVKKTFYAYKKKELCIDHYLRHTWTIIRGDDDIKFTVRFSPKVARYVEEAEFFVKPVIKKQTDGSILFYVKVNSEFEFMRWLNQYGHHAEILEPRSYRKKQKEALQDWLSLYSDV